MQASSLSRYVPEFNEEDKKGRLVETKMKYIYIYICDFVGAAAHAPLFTSPPSLFLTVLLWQLQTKFSPGGAPEARGRGPAAVFLCRGELM